MRPHRRQPTRLPHPWDSPGKNTGVGCHFLLQFIKVKSESEDTQSCPTVSDPMDFSLPGSSIHGIFQARVLELGCHCLLCLPQRSHLMETTAMLALFCTYYCHHPSKFNSGVSCVEKLSCHCSSPGLSDLLPFPVHLLLNGSLYIFFLIMSVVYDLL